MGAEIDARLRAAVEAWVADDPGQCDREELRALLDQADAADRDDGRQAGAGRAAAELRDRFAGRLTFGTAGLRGAVGAGPNRMNRAVVRAATAAVAGWLLDGGGRPVTVVIGRDARHRSADFADEAARVLAGAGIGVHLLPRPGPTPLLAFAVRHLGARAGIMITASHNPAADNGYKLYLSDGAQVIPPADTEIEARIARLGPLAAVRTASLDDPLITRHGDEVAAAYLDAIAGPAAAPAPAPSSPSPAPTPPAAGLKVVYTPMHGVAGDLMLRAMHAAGFGAPHVVPAQAKPDPDFPTVAFPNPEEPGALDLALADARALGAELVLASDPDGDRLAVAVPDPAARGLDRAIDAVRTYPIAQSRPAPPASPAALKANGPASEWRQLTGDQVGALLGAYLLGAGAGAGEGPGPGAGPRPDPGEGEGPQAGDSDRLVATTIVSSTMLSKIAARAGARYRETLTGFKWIARAGDNAGSTFLFGYEEALGYEVGQAVRDKDGIGAALAVLRMTATAKSNGRSLLDELDQLEAAHGVHLTEQLSLRIPDPAGVLRRLRAAPPGALGGAPVETVTDYAGPGTGLPPSDVLSYALRQARAVIRPSGTEPKIKAYLEVVEPVADDLAAARDRAARRMAPLRAAVTALLAG